MYTCSDWQTKLYNLCILPVVLLSLFKVKGVPVCRRFNVIPWNPLSSKVDTQKYRNFSVFLVFLATLTNLISSKKTIIINKTIALVSHFHR